MNFLTQEQFTEMWKLQDALNSVTSGPAWKEKHQDWNLAIKDEVMEFYKYIGWKWWKEPDATKSPKDMQARLELVDIWHFLLSSIIELSTTDSDSTFESLRRVLDINEVYTSGGVHEIQELDQLRVNNWHKVICLTSVIHACDWSWQELYQAYIGKVALNNFRQANGYKEGTYLKFWWNEEDNAHLENIMRHLQNEHVLTYDRVYSALSQSYLAWKEEVAEQGKDL